MCSHTFNLSNGAWLRCNQISFDFGFKDICLLPNCSNYAYLSKKLFVLKQFNSIYVYGYTPISINGIEQLQLLAEVKTIFSDVFVKVRIGESSFLIDSNGSINIGDNPKIY